MITLYTTMVSATATASETTDPTQTDHTFAVPEESIWESGGGLGGGASFISDTGAMTSVTTKLSWSLRVFTISVNFVLSVVTSFSSTVKISAYVVVSTVNSTFTLSVAA